MAPPSGNVSRPGRALAVLAAVIVLLFLAIVGGNIGSPGHWSKDFKVKLGLDLTGPLAMKLTGTFVLSGGTGVEFNGLPDIPISNFALTFAQNGLVVNPSDLCDGQQRVFGTEFESHSGVTLIGSKAAALDGCTAGGPKGAGKGKCKKKRKKGKRSDAAAAKKKRKKCKRKKRRKR